MTRAPPCAGSSDATARSVARPAENGRPTRRSGRAVPHAPLPATPATAAPASLPPRPAAPHIHAAHTLPLPAPAVPSGPASRWASAAASPAAQTPPAPCTPATSPPAVRATPARLLPLLPRRPLCWCSRPPVASPPDYLPAPPPLLRLPPPARLSAPRSLPALCGGRESSLESHCVQETRCFRPADSALNPRSCTCALREGNCTDPAQTAPPSTPDGSDILVLPQPPRCRSLPPLLPAPASRPYPVCRSACSRLAARYGTLHPLLEPHRS